MTDGADDTREPALTDRCGDSLPRVRFPDSELIGPEHPAREEPGGAGGP